MWISSFLPITVYLIRIKMQSHHKIYGIFYSIYLSFTGKTESDLLCVIFITFCQVPAYWFVKQDQLTDVVRRETIFSSIYNMTLSVLFLEAYKPYRMTTWNAHIQYIHLHMYLIIFLKISISCLFCFSMKQEKPAQ